MDEVFWIEGNPATGLAIVLCPRGDWRIEDEMLRMRRGGVETVVSLLEPDEASMLGLAQEGPAAQKAGMRFVSFPIPDVHVPPHGGRFRTFVSDLSERLRAGERIGMHCRGSIGRATVTAACTLVHLGWTPADALKAIEKARGLPVPDTEEQRRWILS